jgi:hypothetical protein
MERLDQIPQQAEETRPAVELLRELETSKQAAAINARLGGRLDPAEADAVLARLSVEAKKRKRRRRITTAVGIAYAAIFLALFLGWLGHGYFTGRWAHFPWQMFQSFQFVGIFGGAAAASRFQKNATAVLAQFDDPRYVGPLAEALEYGDKNTASLARSALTRLLPALRPDQGELLNDDQRAVLGRALFSNDSQQPLVLAIVKALEQVGDERDCAAVKRLAGGEGALGKHATVREAAAACLPYVEQRAEQNRAASTLLRAATSSGGVEELLRPAQGAPTDDAALLLRAESVPESETPPGGH